MFVALKDTFYRMTRVPKTPSELGALFRDYKSDFLSPIRIALDKKFISANILLEFSVISRNFETLVLSLEYGATIDSLSPPFGIEIKRKRHTPVLHALFDNNVAFFEFIAEHAPEQFSDKAVSILLKALTKENVDPNTSIDVLQILLRTPTVLIHPKDMYHLALLCHYDTLEAFVLSLPPLDKLLDTDFLLDNIQDHLHRCSDNMAAHLLNKLEKAHSDKRQKALDQLLNQSAKAGRSHICEMLIEKGADINSIHQGGLRPYSAFSTALLYGHKATVDVFFKHHADFHYHNGEYHILIDAVKGGVTLTDDVIRILRVTDIPQDILSKALYFAANNNQPFRDDIYHTLLEKGADPLFIEAEFFDDASALFASILQGHIHVFALLLHHVKTMSKDEKSALYGLHHLLKAYTDPQFKSTTETEAQVAQLIKKERHAFNQTQLNDALIMVAEKGRKKACELFLSIGADPNYTYTTNVNSAFTGTAYPSTALIQAIKEEQFKVAQLLFEHGARVDTKVFSTLEQMGEQGNIYGLRFLMRAGGIIPRSLSDNDALTMTACETWTEVLDELKEDQAYLLPYILPRYYGHLNITPMEYLSRCPEWHKYYVMATLNDF